MPDALPGRKLAFSHFGISCVDLPKMVAFYTETMGMIVSDQGTTGRGVDIAFLTTDPADHHQLVLAGGRKNHEVTDAPVAGGDAGAAIFQMSFRLDDLATLRSMVARLRAAGVKHFTPINHGNAWAVYTRDVEGNTVELFVDSPWYVHQPCGLPLDLAKSDEEILAETEAYCLAQPEVTPNAEWRLTQAAKIVANQASI